MKANRKDDGRKYIGDRSVGSVDLQKIVRDRSNDYALVEVRWAGNIHLVDRQGRVEDLRGWKRYRTLFVLMRKRGVKTNVQRSVNSAHCVCCGAPESDVVSDACEYCEEVLNTGQHDWVLSALHPASSQRATKWLSRLPVASPTPERRASHRTRRNKVRPGRNMWCRCADMDDRRFCGRHPLVEFGQRTAPAKVNPHDGDISAVDFDETGRRLGSASEDGSIVVWNPDDYRQMLEPLGLAWKATHPRRSPHA